MSLTRRGFIATGAATVLAKGAPQIGAQIARRPKIILELVYDKGLGMMRAVERVIW